MKGAAMSDKKCPNCGYQLDSWNDCVSVNNILECPECEEHFELKAVTLNKPQLTIPKSIAESLERQSEDIYEEECFEELVWDWTYEKERAFRNENPDKFIPQNIYQEHYNRLAICRIYLESLTLGVDLVKVVETNDQ